ncbi:MAG: Smr/MutS family protein [Pseudomonadota bacterium]
MSKYFPPDDEDLIFFRKAMQDVKRSKRIPVLKKTPKKFSPLKQRIKSISEKKEVQHKFTMPLPPLSDPITQIIAVEEKLFFRRQGPQLKVIKKLMQGEIPRSACLDLHGMSVEQARLAVVQFLQVSRSAGFRCVQIIHGKGQLTPKLKNHINYWLPQIPWVLAFSSAQPRDGGAGGVYILLGRSPSTSNK